MKKSILVVLILTFSSIAQAQTQAEKDDATLIQTLYGEDKRALMADFLDMPKKDSIKFWATYDSYEAARKKIGNKRWSLMYDYINSYDSLDNDKAEKLAMELLNNNMEMDKLHKKYYKKFSQASSQLKAAQFLQMELYFQNIARQDMAEDIPFIGEKLKNKKE